MIVPGMMQLYVTRAHVFQINTETKNSWVSKDESAVPVGFFGAYDPQLAQVRGVKIVAQDRDGNTLIDSSLTSKTIFNKRSQKFGQWTDPSGMIYGLGFNTEDDLNQFISTFHQVLYDAFHVKKDNPIESSPAQQQTQQAATAGYANNLQQQSQQTTLSQQQQPQQPRQTSNFTSETNGHYLARNDDQSQPSSAAQPVQQEIRRAAPAHQTPEKNVEPDSNNNGMNGSNGAGQQDQDELISHSPSPNGPDLQIQQLMYENERIKETLEEAKKNAVLWETELQNLRTNNNKLTQALQESKSNVDEWERELQWLRDENKDLKKRLLSGDDVDDKSGSDTELGRMRSMLEMTQLELQVKTRDLNETEQELKQLEAKLKEFKIAENGKSDDATSVEVAISLAQKQRFDQINSKLEAKISELINVQKEYAQLADKLYH